MASYAGIRDGLKTRLETISLFLAVHDTVPSRTVAPAAIVVPGIPVVDYHQSMEGSGGSLQRFRFDVVCAVQQMSEPFSQDDLDGLVSGSGSVKTAIEGDVTLGGAALTSVVQRCTDYGEISIADTTYTGCRFEVEVYAR